MKETKLYHSLIILSLISLAILMTFSALSNNTIKNTMVQPVRIVGSYAIDGQIAHELTNSNVFDTSTLHTIIISGHLLNSIPEGQALMMHLDNIRVTIRINGIEVYRFGAKESIPPFSKTAGSAWGFYISPGITQADKIEIALQNIYADTITNAFDDFLSGLSFGHGFELYQTAIQGKMPSIIFGFAIFVASIISFMICTVARLLRAPNMNRGMALACVTMTGGVWIFINGGYPYVSLLFNNPLLFNMIDALQIFVISVVLVIFTYTCMENIATQKVAKMIAEASLALLTLAVSLQIAGIYDLYEIQNWAVAIDCCIVGACIGLLFYEGLVLGHRQTLFVLLSWLPLFVSAFLEAINYFIRFMPQRAMIQYGFAVSVLLQCIQLVRAIRENVTRMQKAARIEYELLQSNMAVMLSQIQPHFLINTLNDIRFLYRESPDLAEDALVSFTRYLRGNMESLNHQDVVPFEQELNHVKSYTVIEKMRFRNRLNMIYEIGCSQFSLPVLTIQPLVENAIRHGVMKKPEGGTVTLQTFEDAHHYVVEVRDDGVGFDTFSQCDDGRTHTGIQNVRVRLQSLCGGSLFINSRAGEGTVSLIRIPKGDQA